MQPPGLGRRPLAAATLFLVGGALFNTLMFFGWNFFPFSIAMIVAFLLSLRAEREREAGRRAAAGVSGASAAAGGTSGVPG